MSDSVGNGVSIGGLTRVDSVDPESDLVPVTQGYTTPGTGTTRAATPSQLERAPVSQRTVAITIVGKPPDAQPYQVVFTQAGSLTTTGAVGNVLTAPTATNHLTLATVNSGTINSQGTIAIGTDKSVTFPGFTTAMAVGDSLRITNQATADATGADYAFGLPFSV